MTVVDAQLASKGPWLLGFSNLTSETAPLRNQTGATVSLREATNVDFDSQGWPSSRDGYALAVGGTNVHSCWSDDYLPWGLYVDASGLRVVHGDLTNSLLVAGLATGMPVSYCRINNAVAWSNGAQRGQVGLDLEVSDWCCPCPTGQLSVAAAAGGALDAGTYNFTQTFVDAFGRESGAQLAAALDIPAGSYANITGISQPANPTLVPFIRIYATGGNDGLLRAAVTLPAGTTSYLLAQRPVGKPLETQFLRPLPAGQIVRTGAGRQFVARNNEVLFSPALRYGLYHPGKHRVGFNGRVDMMEFVGDGTSGAGLYVADAKRTYFLSGADPADWKQVIASPYGAVPGTAATVAGDLLGLDSDAPVPVWLSRNGFLCVGGAGGQITVLKQNQAVIDQAESGALLFREEGGARQLVVALKGAQPSPLAVRDEMIVREYRHTA